jgi:hypothetical protein
MFDRMHSTASQSRGCLCGGAASGRIGGHATDEPNMSLTGHLLAICSVSGFRTRTFSEHFPESEFRSCGDSRPRLSMPSNARLASLASYIAPVQSAISPPETLHDTAGTSLLIAHIVAQSSANTRCTNEIAIEPSPTAEATRFTLSARTSPTANTPGKLVSSI